MASSRGVAYIGPGMVEVQSIDFPKLNLAVVVGSAITE
jgi:hypothetical protein